MCPARSSLRAAEKAKKHIWKPKSDKPVQCLKHILYGLLVQKRLSYEIFLADKICLFDIILGLKGFF